MRTLLVVLGQPFLGDVLYLFDRLEQVRIEHFVSVGPGESLDVRVLVRFAGLDVAQLDALALQSQHG